MGTWPNKRIELFRFTFWLAARYAITAIALLCGILPCTAFAQVPGDGQIRGIVRSLAEVTVTADLNAPVTSAPFKKGEAFTKGGVLLEFDCRRYREDLAGAEADARAGLAFLRSQTEMAGHGAAGRNDVEIAEAKYDKARAAARGLAIRMEQCTIRAPFDGTVREISAREFETPQPGTPLMKIIGTAQLEIGIVAPSKSLAWLKPGMEFQFLADETGEAHRAAIARFGAAADPVSQTIEVIAVFLDAPRNLLPGMSGTALFAKPSG